MRPEQISPIERRLMTAARGYRKEGYRVEIRPSRDVLPAFLHSFQPDIVAFRDDESVVIEAKSASSLAGAQDIGRLAQAVEGRPGWRFELLVVGGRARQTGSRELPLSADEIRRRLVEVARLSARSQPDSAFILLWSAFEATLRWLARVNDIDAGKESPAAIIKHLTMLGLLRRGSYGWLEKAVEARNSLVHGLPSPVRVATLMPKLLELTETLADDIQRPSESARRKGTRRRAGKLSSRS